MRILLRLLLLLAAVPALGQTRHFVLLHSNDTHGHLLPYSLPKRSTNSDADIPVRKNIGGVARRATVIKDIRAHNPYVYCFDAGDNMDGTPFSIAYHDRADYAAINAMRYDYCVTGNHEYSLDADSLKALVRTLTPKLVLANVTDRNTHQPLGKPYVLENWGGVRVAIAGLVTDETRAYRAARQTFDVEDPYVTAKKLVPRLRSKADLVILVTHTGVAVDRKIAQNVPGVDVIVGGHSHTRLAHGIYQRAAHPAPGDPPGTIIVQTGCWGGEFGRLDLTVTKNAGKWQVTSHTASLLPLDSTITDDPAVKDVVEHYWKPIHDRYSDTLGYADADFTDNDGEPSTNYYLVSDACNDFARCQFSLQNVGGVRASLLQGPVTSYDLVSMIPFVDTLAVATVSGAGLDSILNESFAQPSRDIQYTIHHWKADSLQSRPEKWLISDIKIQGTALVSDSIYTFCSSDYFVNAERKHLRSVRLLTRTTLDVLADYVRRQKHVAPEADNRILLKEE